MNYRSIANNIARHRVAARHCVAAGTGLQLYSIVFIHFLLRNMNIVMISLTSSSCERMK